jgi:hypothetical protein
VTSCRPVRDGWVRCLRRASRQDPSKLTDICRQTVVFRDLDRLVDCLRAIRDDPEARVLRVKNRLDPAYDSGASAGYRDVALNLQLANAQTGALGVDTHVCELQLLLVPFAELKVRARAALPTRSR